MLFISPSNLARSPKMFTKIIEIISIISLNKQKEITTSKDSAILSLTAQRSGKPLMNYQILLKSILSPILLYTYNNENINTPTEISEAINDYFINIAPQLAIRLPPRVTSPSHLSPRQLFLLYGNTSINYSRHHEYNIISKK